MSEPRPDAVDSAEPVPPRRQPDDGPPRSARASRPPQSAPADGPPPRSALGDKARALPTSATARRRPAAVGVTPATGDPTRPRPPAAEVTRAAAGGSTRGAAGKTTGKAARADHNASAGSARTVARERPGGPWPMPERSLMATVLGVHPAAAVGVAAALTGVGVAVDLLRTGTLSTAFTVCYLTGCVLATAWVRRSGMFWPMVAPPLLMAIAVPVVVLAAGTPRPGEGIAGRLLVFGAPLVNGFPMMAWTTGLVVALGVFRLVTQRINPGRAAARAGGRTSTSPPPS